MKQEDMERKCRKCKYRWIARIEEPKKCPSCGTRKWTG